VTQDVRSDPGGLVPGEQLAGYQIQEQIGRGGMAVVYRALDLRLGRVVALKVLAPHLGEDEAFRQRFIRESRASAGVDHPHIIPVFEAGEASGVLFIAMRYVEHGDVRWLLDTEGRLTPSRACAIAVQVASALDTAHAHGLVHRDVKPGNILLARASNDADHVYLSDFGLSKHSLTPSTLTSTGQFLGTLDYVSPEQIQGHPVDGRADQYALACTVVEMLTGAPPFRRDDTMAIMWAQLESEPPRVTQRRPELPPAVDEVIAAAMAKSPASRYPTCRDFALALKSACAGPARPWTAPAQAPVRWSEAQPAQAPYAAPNAGLPQNALPPPALPQNALGQTAYDLDQALAYRRDPAGVASAAPKPPGAFGAGAWSDQPDTRLSAHVRRRGHRGRGLALALVLTVACLAGAGGIAYALSHRHHGGLPPAATSSGPPAARAKPGVVVREYFAAINHHHYMLAYRLGPKTEPFIDFKKGFADTARDTVTIQGVSGNVVTAYLVALQKDGTTKTFKGTYTVVNGTISSSNIHQVS